MNAEKLSCAMLEISDRFIWEAAEYRAKSRRPAWVKWSVAAACAVFVCVAAFIALPGLLNGDVRRGADSAGPSAIGITRAPAAPDNKRAFQIKLQAVSFNEISGFSDAARRYYDPALYDTAVWDAARVADYFGRDLTPPYIPNGLSAAADNGSAAVVVGKDGAVVEDTVQLSFYHAYYGDGSPRLTDAVAACKGFSLTASKIGLVKDCCYLLPENELKVSYIAETPVTFGYRSMPYGPYDPLTHAPAGHYDMYVAEFSLDGIQYQIVAEQLAFEELVKVVSSVVSGCAEVEVLG